MAYRQTPKLQDPLSKALNVPLKTTQVSDSTEPLWRWR